MHRSALALALLTAAACGGADAELASSAFPAAAKRPPRTSSWPETTESPRPEARYEGLSCEADAALSRVARRLADRRARGLGTADADEAITMLRREGEPDVRPRIVTAAGRAPIDTSVLAGEIAAAPAAGRRRCGLAKAPTAHGGEVAVAVVVDALADLKPLPVRARAGQWLTLEAALHVPISSAVVLVTGERGAPRTVPTTLDAAKGTARARFALDRPGAFSVQLVGEGDAGPRPLLEARVFADVEPPDEDTPAAAPGEEAAQGADEAALARMIDALRASEGLGPLARDPDLDALARAHAEKMREAGRVAHDLGEGDARARMLEASVDARTVGENVARGASLLAAHRALHASPSHRMNLLRAEYTHTGLAVVAGDDGLVYVCELFAARR